MSGGTGVGFSVGIGDGGSVVGVAVEIVGVTWGVATDRCCFCEVQDEERTTKRHRNTAFTFENMVLPRLVGHITRESNTMRDWSLSLR